MITQLLQIYSIYLIENLAGKTEVTAQQLDQLISDFLDTLKPQTNETGEHI